MSRVSGEAHFQQEWYRIKCGGDPDPLSGTGRGRSPPFKVAACIQLVLQIDQGNLGGMRGLASADAVYITGRVSRLSGGHGESSGSASGSGGMWVPFFCGMGYNGLKTAEEEAGRTVAEERKSEERDSEGKDLEEKNSDEKSPERKNYTYLLRCADGSLYCGWTNHLEERVKAHNEGAGAKYTRSRRPVELVYYEVFATRQEAMRREYALKQLTHQEKERLVENWKSG